MTQNEAMSDNAMADIKDETDESMTLTNYSQSYNQIQLNDNKTISDEEEEV